MPKRFPEWVNTEVVIKAIKMREEGMLSKQLNLWIENLLDCLLYTSDAAGRRG